GGRNRELRDRLVSAAAGSRGGAERARPGRADGGTSGLSGERRLLPRGRRGDRPARSLAGACPHPNAVARRRRVCAGPSLVQRGDRHSKRGVGRSGDSLARVRGPRAESPSAAPVARRGAAGRRPSRGGGRAIQARGPLATHRGDRLSEAGRLPDRDGTVRPGAAVSSSGDRPGPTQRVRAPHARGYLLTKARVPPWVLVVTSISNAVITLAVFSVVIAIFLVGASHPPTPAALAAFGAYCVAMMAIVIGFSLGASVLFLRYRDLNQVWEVVLQAGFFIAPIIYPLGILPERFHFYLYVWPPTPVIEFSRAALVAGVMPTTRGHLYLAGDAVFCLLAGMVIFRLLSPRAAEYV